MISVCLATYNGEKFIGSQIDSILSQISLLDEIIISDDGSCDRTIEIISAFRDTRIKIYRNTRKGIVSNFENALSMASGDYIFLSDQDDIWLPNKISVMMRYLGEFDLILSDGHIISSDLPVNGCSLYSFTRPTDRLMQNILRNTFTGCCMAFNRKILSSSIPFPRSLPIHDWWIGLVAVSIGSVKIIDDKLIFHRRHESNTSTLTSRSSADLFSKVKMRYYLLLRLVGRLVALKAGRLF